MAACPSRVETCSDSSSRKALQQMHCSSSLQSGEAAWRSTGASNRDNGGPCYKGCPPQRSFSCKGCLQLAWAPCPQVSIPVKNMRALGWRELQHKHVGPSLNPQNLHKASYSSLCLFLVLLRLDGRERENPGGSQANQPGAYSSKQKETLSETRGTVRAVSQVVPLPQHMYCACACHTCTRVSAHTHTPHTLPKLLKNEDLAKFFH